MKKTMPEHDAILAAHPVDIYRALNSVFPDTDWLAWEPETILLELKNDVSDAAVDKLLAVQAVCSNSNAVVRSAAAFEKVVNAFCNNICVMDVIQPPEVEEMSYAVSQIEKLIHLVHGEKAVIEYIGEVPAYVASVARFRNWFMLPRNLQFAQDNLNSLLNCRTDSKKYKEHKHILDAVSDFVMGTTRKDARELLQNAVLTELETDDTSSLLVRHILGALLFDPTILYAKRNTDPAYHGADRTEDSHTSR